MVMMFEDNEKSGISKLLIRAYENDSRTSIVFARGNENIVNKLREINDTAIVYVDVVPDKGETIDAYNMIISDESLNNKKVFVVPIPCIEYYVIKAFVNKDISYVKNLLDGGNYKEYLVNGRGCKLSNSDLEAYCKSIVKNYKGCFRNNGKFYIQDCLCEDSVYMNDCETINMQNKSCKLVCSLPVFGKLENNIVQMCNVNINEVIEKCKQSYYELANRYVEYGIIKVVQNLAC